MGYRSISIGTIKARINGQFKNLLAKDLAIIMVERIVTFFHSSYYTIFIFIKNLAKITF